MAFGRKQEPDPVRPPFGGAVHVPSPSEVDAVLGRAGSDLDDPDLELFEVVRENFLALHDLHAESTEGEFHDALDRLLAAIDEGVGSTRVRHAAKVAVRNVLARLGVRPVRVGVGDPLGRLDRVEVEVAEERVYSRRLDHDHVVSVERRGYVLATGEILRSALVVASAGRRPELLDFLHGVRRFRAMGDQDAIGRELLAETEARPRPRREDLLALAQIFEAAQGQRPGADWIGQVFLEPLLRVLAAEGIGEPFGVVGGDPTTDPGAYRIEAEEPRTDVQRGRICRVVARGFREPRTGRVLRRARVVVSRGEPADLGRAVEAVAAAAARLESEGTVDEPARRLVGSLENQAHRLGDLSADDANAVAGALTDLQGFLAESVLEKAALEPGDGAVQTARDLVADLTLLLGGWGYVVFPDPRTLDPAAIRPDELREVHGAEAVEIAGVYEDGAAAGTVLFIRSPGLARGDELLHPATLLVALGTRPPILDTLDRLEARLPDLDGEVAAAVRERVDRFRARLSEEADHRSLLKVVNLLDQAGLEGGPEGASGELADVVDRLVEHLREAGIEEFRIDTGVPFDSLPPDYYHVRKVHEPHAPENEVVRVLQRAFRDASGLLLQQARIEVNVPQGS